MGADIYDWERVNGAGSYQRLIDGGCGPQYHQGGCSHQNGRWRGVITAKLDDAETRLDEISGKLADEGDRQVASQVREHITATMRLLAS